MPNKWRRWVCLLIIVALAWIELQFFTEAANVGETTRQVAHILFLLAIMSVGYFAFNKSSIKWLNLIWVGSYLLVLAIMVGVGVLNKVMNLGVDFLDEVRLIRVFFSSPTPFLMLLVLEYLQKQRQ